MLTDAIQYEKLDQMRLDFSGYIESNISKIEDKLPVFYGHVISALDSSFPDLDVESYDAFIDAITFKLLDAATRTRESGYTEKLIESALLTEKREEWAGGPRVREGLTRRASCRSSS